MENMCKEDLMKLIRSTNFAMLDLGLYLNTHPKCQSALATYHDYHHTLMKAVKIYE